MVYRTIIHLNIELQIPVIYRADFGLRGFTPFESISKKTAEKSLQKLKCYGQTDGRTNSKQTKSPPPPPPRKPVGD